jgi:hypothetical protein
MSLISFRNLTAPFRSKIQLGGLIIAALLVLVIRLGASGPSSNQSSDVQRGVSNDAEDEAIRRAQLTELLEEPEQPRRPVGKRQQAGADDLLDELVDGRFDKQQQRQKRQADTSGNSFEDIRRSLGIE